MVRHLFLRYWLSDFVASFGSGLRMAAFPLLAAGLTRSPAAIGAVVAIQAVPWLLFGPFVGVIVDRRDLRQTMVVVEVAQAVVIAALAAAVIARVDTLLLVYVVALVTGVGATVVTTAAQTAIPRLVEPEDLPRANGRLVAGELIGSELVGPAAAGWLFGLAAAVPFALNAGGSGVAVLLLLTLPSVFAPLPRPSGRPEGRVRSALADLREGLAWLFSDVVTRRLTIFVGVVAMADAAWFAILVLYVTRTLHQGAGDYGLLLAVGSVGGIAASSGCAWLTRRVGTRPVLGATVAVMGVTQLVLGLTSDLAVTAVMLAASSGAFAAFNVLASGIRQEQVPTRLLGRVTSAYLAVAGGSEAVGALLGGLLATSAGIRAPMLAGVVPLVAVAVFILLRRPSLASPS